jgi:L-ascorbate metabolism protein UlaG (beta-lactamase superfamily)
MASIAATTTVPPATILGQTTRFTVPSNPFGSGPPPSGPPREEEEDIGQVEALLLVEDHQDHPDPQDLLEEGEIPEEESL